MTKDGKKQKNNPGRVKFYVDEDVDMTLVDSLRACVKSIDLADFRPIL
jgi:hypothetical protein